MICLSSIYMEEIFMKASMQKKEKLDQKELASFLKTTPEALQRFEDSYQYYAIDQNPETGNLFDEQKKSMPSNDGFTPEQEACINRVVNEFLSNSKLLEWDGVKLQDHGKLVSTIDTGHQKAFLLSGSKD